MLNHIKQINVDKVLKYSKRKILAGEDGFIKVIYNTNRYKQKEEKGEKMLEITLDQMTDADSFLANIEDADEFSNGDIIVCTTDGDFGLYIFDKEEKNNYTLQKLDFKIKDDCIYSIITKEENKKQPLPLRTSAPSQREGKAKTNNHSKRKFECWGEKGVRYFYCL